MIRLVVFLIAVGIAAFAATWLAERPGDVAITWMGWRIETSVMVLVAALAALVAVLMFLWSVMRFLLRSPRLAARALHQRRRQKGQRALSRGLIALASGDMRAAQRFVGDAGRLAEDEPLTLLLQAQTAQVAGDRAAADKAFRAMAQHAETRLLGLRGLFVEAERRGDLESARQYAEQAARSAPALPWAGQAVFDFRCAANDWAGALASLDTNLRAGLIDRAAYRRQRAVLLTARALNLEARDTAAAKALALEAAKLAPDLVPAATLAGRLAAESGELRRAAKLLEGAWRQNPHPDIAELYAHLRSGDSARDRLARVRALARMRPGEREGAVATARAAIHAQEFAEARAALAPWLEQPTQRVAMLMAELAELEHGDLGRAREWMARALRAPRDPAWTADGIVSERWLPVSPISGRVDAFVWKVPVAEIGHAATLDAAAPLPHAVSVGRPIAGEPDAADEGDHHEAARSEPEPPVPPTPPASISEPSPRSTPVAAPGVQPPAPSLLPRDAAPPMPARAAAVIPLIHAPDDPGPEPEDAARDGGGGVRGALR